MSQDSWHLSKSVPITFIAAIVLQTVALVGYDENIKAIRNMVEKLADLRDR